MSLQEAARAELARRDMADAARTELARRDAEEQQSPNEAPRTLGGMGRMPGADVIKRGAKLTAHAVGPSLLGGAAELGMLPINTARALKDRSMENWVSPIGKLQEQLPADWAPKNPQERLASTIMSVLTPGGIGKAGKAIGHALEAVAPHAAKAAAKGTPKWVKATGHALADESPGALAKMVPGAAVSHLAVENDAHPALAAALGIGTNIPVNYLATKPAKLYSEWVKNYAIQDPEIQKSLIKNAGNKVFHKNKPQTSMFVEDNLPVQEVTPQKFGQEVQDIAKGYAKSKSQHFKKEYTPIDEALVKSQPIDLEPVMDTWLKPLHSKENVLEKNYYLKSPQGKDFLRLLNVKEGTNFEKLEYDVVSKLFQKSFEPEKGALTAPGSRAKTIKDLSPEDILNGDSALSKILTPETRAAFSENFEHHKGVLYDPKSSAEAKAEANKFFNSLRNNRTEINAAKNPYQIRELARENASLGNYHGLPSSKQHAHASESKVLKEDLLHGGLEETNPQLSKDLRKADAENSFWQKRKKMVGSFIGSKNEPKTPEQAVESLLSDFGKGSRTLKFIKGIAGEKANAVSDNLLTVLGTEGQDTNVINLYKKYKTLPKEDAKIFWMGITPDTKKALDKSFNMIEELAARNNMKTADFNPVANYAKTPTLNWWKRFKKNLFKARAIKKYTSPKGMQKLEEHLLTPQVKAPWFQETRTALKKSPMAFAKQEANRPSRKYVIHPNAVEVK